MLVPTGELGRSFRGILRNNETAGTILKLLQTERTKEELTEEMQKKYEVDPGTLRNDIDRMIRLLRKEAFLVEEEE